MIARSAQTAAVALLAVTLLGLALPQAAQARDRDSRSLGIMQINQHVWRGFYSVDRLKWDTAYNARAGAQILMRYMKDYAIDYADRSGNLDHVPRAMYAAYNAGPRAVGRFNKPHTPAREQRVDQRLWTLYQGIAAGGQADLGTCSIKIAATTP